MLRACVHVCDIWRVMYATCVHVCDIWRMMYATCVHVCAGVYVTCVHVCDIWCMTYATCVHVSGIWCVVAMSRIFMKKQVALLVCPSSCPSWPRQGCSLRSWWPYLFIHPPVLNGQVQDVHEEAGSWGGREADTKTTKHGSQPRKQY